MVYEGARSIIGPYLTVVTELVLPAARAIAFGWLAFARGIGLLGEASHWGWPMTRASRWWSC